MTADDIPRYCYCWSGRARWRLCPEDRVCGLCGRRLIDVLPDAPVLQPGPPPVLVAYLDTARVTTGAGGLVTYLGARLTFHLVGPPGRVDVSWSPRADTPLALVKHFIPSPSTLKIVLQAEARGVPAAGPCGGGRLAIAWHEESFEFEVAAFALAEEPPRAWMTREPGTPSRPPAQQVMNLYRGAEPFPTYLHFELPGAIPFEWHGVSCDHLGVRVAPRGGGCTTGVAWARVDWDPTTISPDTACEKVAFHLAIRGRPDFLYTLFVCWRLKRPLQFQPAGLLVPLLAADTSQQHAIELTNLDPLPLTIDGPTTSAPWIVITEGGTPFPFSVQPGQTAVVQLELRPEHLGDLPGAHRGEVVFHFKDRGSQRFAVAVLAVRPLTPLDGPLLIDPGPPRVVVAWTEPDGGRLRYLPSSGEDGLEPDELGVPPDEYARAVYGGVGAANLLDRIVRAAVVLTRKEAQRTARSVLLCRQAWVPEELDAGASLCDWDRLAQLMCAGKAPHLVRLNAWATHVMLARGTDAAASFSAPRAINSHGFTDTVGGLVLDCLLRGFGDTGAQVSRLLGILDRQSRAGGADASRLWMFGACESLLKDYRWGRDYAWRRLLQACWQHEPSTRRPDVDLAAVHAAFQDALAEHVSCICRMLARADAARPCLLFGDLFRSEELREAVESINPSLPIRTEVAPARWLEWMAAAAVPPGSVSP